MWAQPTLDIKKKEFDLTHTLTRPWRNNWSFLCGNRIGYSKSAKKWKTKRYVDYACEKECINLERIKFTLNCNIIQLKCWYHCVFYYYFILAIPATYYVKKIQISSPTCNVIKLLLQGDGYRFPSYFAPIYTDGNTFKARRGQIFSRMTNKAASCAFAQ